MFVECLVALFSLRLFVLQTATAWLLDLRDLSLSGLLVRYNEQSDT